MPSVSTSDLRASVEEAQQAQLAALPKLASYLARAQALAFETPFSRADYAELAAGNEQALVDEALDTLVHQGVLTHSGTSYSLLHPGTRAALTSQLTATERAGYHRALAELCARSGRSGIIELHHLWMAGLTERALDRLSRLLCDVTASGYLFEQHQVDARTITAILERTYPVAVASMRPVRELRELGRQLVGLSIQTDNELYYRYAGPWLAQLAQDSGLAEYRALDDTMPHAERLKLAIERTLARYGASAEAERGYGLDEAIRHLAQYVTTSIAIGSRASDTALLGSLPSIVEPFAGFTPVMHALWQNVIASDELRNTGVSNSKATTKP